MKRCRHSYGFGIQSPWAYQFDRFTVNEHAPYYSYEDLRKKMPDLGDGQRKLLELYFRCTNYRQPQNILYYGNDFEPFSAYCHCGCSRAKIHSFGDSSLPSVSHIDMLFISPVRNYRDDCLQLLDALDEQSMLVFESINENKETKQFWRELVDDSRTGVTFDLYYCGIIFFDKKRYKEKYVINF